MCKNMVQSDRQQATIWYSQTDHRLQYGTVGQTTGYNMVQPDRPQATIWYSHTDHRLQYGTAVQTTANISCVLHGG
jgi:hypothetical protein